MEKDTTRNLSYRLEQMRRQDRADDFIAAHGTVQPSLQDLLQARIQAGIAPKETIVRRSGISRNYVYNILSGSRKNPGRDKVLALCIASEMSYRQTQQTLESAGLAPLYPRDERDVRIAIAINSGMHDVLSVNLLLDSYGLAPLDV